MKSKNLGGAARRWSLGTLLAGFLFGMASGVATARQPAQQAKPLRVLFLGNSFTYFHNMPMILHALAPNVETRLIAQGGLTLEDHWNNAEARKAVEEGRWDFVVLQEQSTLGETFVINGKTRLQGDRTFRTFAEKWIRAIQAAGAKPVLNMHWKRKDAPARDGEYLNSVITQAGAEWGAVLAPVSLAWQAAERRGAALYAPDGHHPSPAGSYLAACVMYATLLGKSPEGRATRALGPEIEEGNGAVLGGNVELVQLSEREARLLQESAWQARQELASGKVRFPAPAPLEIPKLGPGEPLTAAALEGTWRGPLQVYPFPATLELRFVRKEGALAVEGLITFGGKPDDIRFADGNVDLSTGEIVFADPKGPNDGKVRYRAILRKGQLEGIAEILITKYPVYLIGEWKAQPWK